MDTFNSFTPPQTSRVSAQRWGNSRDTYMHIHTLEQIHVPTSPHTSYMYVSCSMPDHRPTQEICHATPSPFEIKRR